MPYETILMLHITSFVWNISWVVLADTIGLLWVVNIIKHLPKKLMLWAHRFIWLGLSVSIITGSLMFWELRDYLLTIPAFYTKVLFVVALFINSFLISRHLNTALNIGLFSNLMPKEKKSFIFSGAVSTISWVAVFVSAKMLGL